MSLTAQAQLLPPPTAGEFEIKGEFNYFSTSSNYNPDGGKMTLPNGSKLTQMMGLGEFIFDWTNEWRFTAGASAGQAAVDSHTNSGLNEMWVGGQYWYELDAFDLVPEADLVYPGFRVKTESNDPLLGEGALRLKGGAWAIYQWDDFRPFGFLGYEYRDEGRSSLLNYKAGLQYAQSSAWWMQAELRGSSSMTNDSDTDNVGRDVYLTRVQGGSYRDYSLTPSSHEVALLGGFHIGQMGVYAGCSTTYMGRSSADGLTALVGITFDGAFFPPVEAAPQVQSRPSGQHFNVKPEKFDNSLFNDNPVPSSQVPTVVQKSARKRVTRVRPKPIMPAAKPPAMSVELLMKQTEKSLEKKK